MNLREITSKFNIQGLVKEIIPWGNGHINDTFRVITDDGDGDYLLQRVNDNVFKQVKNLMYNQEAVIAYTQENNFDGIFQSNLTVKDALDDKCGDYLYHNDEGWWRMSEFAAGYDAYDLMPNANIARKAGATIGHMLISLSDFDAKKLHITIPDFHNIHHRMNQLNEAWSGTSKLRKEEGQELMERINKQAIDFIGMYHSALSGELPLRATHNDTKLNNLLFHPEKDVGVVVDLDTLMPGYSFFDIGDVLRSGIISAAEDESDLSKVTLNYEAYSAFHEALVKTAKSVLTQKELEYIPLSGGYMSFVLSVRFLTDFFNMDKYFKTKYPNHNLVRAKCQMKVSDLFKELVSANL